MPLNVNVNLQDVCKCTTVFCAKLESILRHRGDYILQIFLVKELWLDLCILGRNIPLP